MKNIKTDVSDRRRSLIEAAGTLIVVKGDPRLVGTREIVAKAGASKSAIDYYFRNKAGLVEAVYAEVRHLYERDAVLEYVEAHRAFLGDRSRHKRLLEDILEAYFGFFAQLSGDDWRARLCIRVLKNNSPRSCEFLKARFDASISALFEVYRAVTGRADLQELYACYESYFLPIAAKFLSNYDRKKMERSIGLPTTYDRYLLDHCKKQLVRQWCGEGN